MDVFSTSGKAASLPSLLPSDEQQPEATAQQAVMRNATTRTGAEVTKKPDPGERPLP